MTEYYLLTDLDKVAKMDDSGAYVWTGDVWKPVDRSFVYDRLYGYDPSEPDGSPYQFGGDIEARRITEEEAAAITGKEAADEPEESSAESIGEKHVLRYSPEHEKLLHELGYADLDAARKAYEEYTEADFIADKLLPYVLGNGKPGQDDIADDLITMLTDWTPGQTEQEYEYTEDFDEDCGEQEDEGGGYYTESPYDFPACNHTVDVGPENIGYTNGVFSDGTPFEAEIYAYGAGKTFMKELAIIMPDFNIDKEDCEEPQEASKFTSEVEMKDCCVLTIGMAIRCQEENFEIIKWYQEYLEKMGIIEYAGNIRSGAIFYYTDINGNDLVQIRMGLITDGMEEAATDLTFRDFPVRAGLDGRTRKPGLSLVK